MEPVSGRDVHPEGTAYSVTAGLRSRTLITQPTGPGGGGARHVTLINATNAYLPRLSGWGPKCANTLWTVDSGP